MQGVAVLEAKQNQLHLLGKIYKELGSEIPVLLLAGVFSIKKKKKNPHFFCLMSLTLQPQFYITEK